MNSTRKRRRPFRALLKFFLFLLLLLVVLLLVAPLIASSGWVKNKALAKVNESMPGTVEADAIEISYLGGLKAKGFKYTDEEGRTLADVDEVYASYGLLDYFRRDSKDLNIILLKPKILLPASFPESTKTGDSSDPDDSSDPSDPADIWKHIPQNAKIQIENGSLALEGQGDYLLDIDLSASLDRETRQVIIDGGLEAINSGDTRIDGTLELPPEDDFNPADIAANISMDGKQLDLSPLLAYATNFSPDIPTGSLNLMHSLEVSGSLNESIVARGGIKLSDLLLSGGAVGSDQARVPEGNIQFDFSKRGEQVLLKELDVRSPFVNGTIQGSFDKMPKLEPGTLSELADQFFAMRGTAGGSLNIDLREIFAQFPQTLSALPNLAVEDGVVEISLDGTEFSNDGQRLGLGIGLAEDLVALDTSTGLRKRFGEMDLDLAIERKAGGQPNAVATIDAPFAAARLNANFEAANLDVSRLDLGALQNQLGQFVDLSHMTLSGTGSLGASVAGLQNDYKFISIHNGKFDRMTVKIDDKTFLDQDFVTKLELDAQVNEKTKSFLDLSADVVSTLGNVNAKLDQGHIPEQGLPQLRGLNANGNLQIGRIGQLVGAMGVLPEGIRVHKGNLTFDVAADVQGEQVKVSKGQLASNDLDISKDGVHIREKIQLQRLSLLADLSNGVEVRDVDIGLGTTLGGMSGRLEKLVQGDSGPPQEIKGLAASGNISLPRVLNLAKAMGVLTNDIQVTGGMLNFQTGADMKGDTIDIPDLLANITDFSMIKDGTVIREPFTQLEGNGIINPTTKTYDFQNLRLKVDVDPAGNSALDIDLPRLYAARPGESNQQIELQVNVDGKLDRLTEKLGAFGLLEDDLSLAGETDLGADLKVHGQQATVTLDKGQINNFKFKQGDMSLQDPVLSVSEGASATYNLDSGKADLSNLTLSGGFGLVNLPRFGVNSKNPTGDLSADLNVQTEIGRLMNYLSGVVDLPPNLRFTGDANLSGSAQMRDAGPWVNVGGKIDGLSITDLTPKQGQPAGGKTLFADPQVDLNLQAQLDQTDDSIAIESLFMDSKPLGFNLGGSLTGLKGNQSINLSGKWAMDLSEITKIIQGTADLDLEMTGKQEENIQFSANLANLMESFTLNTQVRADTFSFMGVKADGITMPFNLKNGQGSAGIGATIINPSGDQATISFKPSFKRDDVAKRYEVAVEPGPILNNVELNQSLASGLLAKLHPIFRNSTVSGGRVGLTLEKAMIPFDASEYKQGLLRQEMHVLGAVPLNGVRLEANGWIRKILDFAKVRENEYQLNDVDMRFSVRDGVVSGSQLKMKVEDVPITMSGAYRLADNQAAYEAAVTLRGSRLPNEVQRYTDEFTFIIPVNGPVDNPRVDIQGALKKALTGMATAYAKKELEDKLGKELGDKLGGNLGNVVGGTAGDFLGGLLGGKRQPGKRLNPSEFAPPPTAPAAGTPGTPPNKPPATVPVPLPGEKPPPPAPPPAPPKSLEDQLKDEAIKGAGQLLEGLFR